MANATLEVMQEIEAAAQSVLADYEAQIQELRSQKESELAAVLETYERETEEQVSAMTLESKERLSQLKSAVDVTVQENDAKVRRALTDKKEIFVQQIVDKVVERYGH